MSLVVTLSVVLKLLVLTKMALEAQEIERSVLVTVLTGLQTSSKGACPLLAVAGTKHIIRLCRGGCEGLSVRRELHMGLGRHNRRWV